jgi:hypothetical protein
MVLKVVVSQDMVDGDVDEGYGTVEKLREETRCKGGLVVRQRSSPIRTTTMC